jgi:hypothetical protein
MPGLAVSSSCIALVSGAMKLVPERRSASGISAPMASTISSPDSTMMPANLIRQ